MASSVAPAVPPEGQEVGSSSMSDTRVSPTQPTAQSPTACEPPYAPPANVNYPENAVENPFAGSTSRQPVFENLPSDSLFRPARLPVDMDSRIEKGSVWIGVDKSTHKAVYFLPPTCKQCSQPGIAVHCDRGYPKCLRCKNKNIECEPGVKWSQMRQKMKRKSEPRKSVAATDAGTPKSEKAEPVKRRYSAVEKGKAKEESPRSGSVQEAPTNDDFDGADDMDSFDHEIGLVSTANDGEGRGKRTKKKRRLSMGEEVDPETLDDDGQVSTPKKKPKPRASLPVPPSFTAWNDPSRPVSAEDTAYFDRIEINCRKSGLKSMRAACPAWATTRRALQNGAEYFRNPSRTEGGSVEVGVGGVARGVILEGESVGDGNFWGVRAAAGTIMTCLGKARHRQSPSDPLPVRTALPDRSDSADPPGPSSPRINILPSVLHLESQDSTSSGPTALPNYMSHITEEPEIESLLMAQRARTPVAIAIAQDYLETPFKVPRAFVVLGWFWLTDAWLEPDDLWLPGAITTSRPCQTSDIDLVRWKFRFEWCRGVQGTPWWSPLEDPVRLPTPYVEYKFIIEPLAISGPGIRGASTVISASKRTATDMRSACPTCDHVSEGIYKGAKVCLNERCARFFMPLGDAPALDPISNQPGPLRPLQRKTPEFLGLKLRGYDPHAPTGDMNRSQVGKDLWRGWVCGKCGMANERRKWNGWDCEGCKHQITPVRKPFTHEQLRNPLRPECTGPRQDHGFAQWPYKVTSGWSLYEHSVKIVTHSLGKSSDSQGNEYGSEIHHALHTKPAGVIDLASRILKDLQSQADSDAVPLRRYLLTSVSRRPAERYLSPFYTLRCGPDCPAKIDSLPTSTESLPWINSPSACLDVMDLINFRAGCMFPGLPEFNSLLLAVTPPIHVPAYQPKITLETGEFLAIMVLGSEGTIKILPYSGTGASVTAAGKPKGKSGEVIMQHGDVMAFRVDKGKLDISVKMDGFGFVCFAQQVYRSPNEPGLGALTQTSDRSKSQVRDLAESAVSSAAVNGTDVAVPAGSNAPPPKPTKFLPAPLIDWYIGPRPLDPSQPLRVGRPLRDRTAPLEAVGDTAAAKSDTFTDSIEVDPAAATGVVILEESPLSPRLLEPDIPPSPSAPAEEILPEPAQKSRRKKGGTQAEPATETPTKPTKSKIKAKEGAGGETVGEKGKGGPRKSKGRKSDIRTESTPASTKGTDDISPAKGSRGKGKRKAVEADHIQGLNGVVSEAGEDRVSPKKSKKKQRKSGLEQDVEGVADHVQPERQELVASELGGPATGDRSVIDAGTAPMGMFWKTSIAPLQTA